jgi:hypothetical protein
MSRSVHSSPTISLNGLCSYCGLEQNPWKEMFKDTLWKLIVYKNVLGKAEPLPEEVTACKKLKQKTKTV